jgi:hypothetical protein
VIRYFILLLLSFSIYSQDFYEIKKRSEDKPIILKVKKLESHQITVITEGTYDVTIPMSEIESIKEYVPNAEKLYKKVVLFVDNTYVEGTIIQTNTKKIVIEIKNYEDLKIFKSKQIEDILDPIEFQYEKSKTRFRAGLHSVVFPGWGQHYGNQKAWKGYLLSAGFLFSAMLTARYYTEAQDAYSTYQASLNYDSSALRRHEDNIYKANLFAIAGLGIWGYSVADSYLFFRTKYSHVQNDLMKKVDAGFEVGVSKSYE